MRSAAVIVSALSICAHSAAAVECRSDIWQGTGYTICEVNAAEENLQLFLRDKDGVIYGQFFAIDSALAQQGLHLQFAMNAGMYHNDRSPVGHYLEDGVQEMRVVSNAGPGNFGLLPNGVFCLRPGRADVIETLRFLEEKPTCEDATQSGPMLVTDGALHPRFLEDGTSRHIRNGVGTSQDGARVVFAISDEPVNFHSFGTLFRDHLEIPDALYFDGNISRMYAPAFGRNDLGFRLGPIVGVVAPAD